MTKKKIYATAIFLTLALAFSTSVVFADDPINEHISGSWYTKSFSYNDRVSSTTVATVYYAMGNQAGKNCGDFNFMAIEDDSWHGRYVCIPAEWFTETDKGNGFNIFTILTYPRVEPYGRGICDSYPIAVSGRYEYSEPLDYDDCLLAGASIYKTFYIDSFKPLEISVDGIDIPHSNAGSPYVASVGYMSKLFSLIVGSAFGFLIVILPYILGIAFLVGVIWYLIYNVHKYS